MENTNDSDRVSHKTIYLITKHENTHAEQSLGGGCQFCWSNQHCLSLTFCLKTWYLTYNLLNGQNLHESHKVMLYD